MPNPFRQHTTSDLQRKARVDSSLALRQELERRGEADFRIENHGTIVLFVGQHEGARQWLQNTAPADAQWFCGKLVVEPRYMEGVVQAAEEAGFTVVQVL